MSAIKYFFIVSFRSDRFFIVERSDSFTPKSLFLLTQLNLSPNWFEIGDGSICAKHLTIKTTPVVLFCDSHVRVYPFFTLKRNRYFCLLLEWLDDKSILECLAVIMSGFLSHICPFSHLLHQQTIHNSFP